MKKKKEKPHLRLVRNPRARTIHRARRFALRDIERIREEAKWNALASVLGGMIAAFFIKLADSANTPSPSSPAPAPTPAPVPPPKTHACDRARSVDVIHITAHCLCDCVSCTLARWPKALQ